MGKRELLLLVGFVVLGLGVYNVSAPAASADAPGFSLSRLMQMAKAHLHGAQVRKTVTSTVTLAVDPTVTTIDLGDIRGTVVIAGSDRDDVEVHVEASIGGVDEADVAQQERALRVSLTTTGTTASLVLASADDRRPRYDVHVSMPGALKVQIAGRNSVEVSGIAGLHLAEFRGELTVEEMAGPVTGALRDARAEFGPGAHMDLDVRNGRLRAEAPASVTLRANRGSVDILDPAGPVSIKTDYARMDIRGTGGPVTITGEGGVIDLREVAHPLSIDADRLTVSVAFAVPVATTIAVSDDTVEVTLPREGGVQLEASIEDGSLRLPTGLTATRTQERESVSAAVDGGGPTVKVDVKGGQLRIRSRAAQPGT